MKHDDFNRQPLKISLIVLQIQIMASVAVFEILGSKRVGVTSLTFGVIDVIGQVTI